MSEHMMPIPSRVYNAAVGGHVCGPEDVDFGQKVVHLIKYDRAGNEVSFESQVTQSNKIYVIHDDFVLSSNVTIPANCVLEFDGGSVSGNGTGKNTITGTNTQIIAQDVAIFNNGIIVAGTWICPRIPSDWFSDVISNNRLQQLINLSSNDFDNTIIVEEGTYSVSNPENSVAPLRLKSNTTFTIFGSIQLIPNAFANGYIIELCNNVENITINGSGELVGDYLLGHTGSSGEWGFNIALGNCKHITIEGITSRNAWGDGICVGIGYWNAPAEDVIIRGCHIHTCRRQGISVIYSDRCVIENCYIHNIYGTAPECCIDVECDSDTYVKNVTIINNRLVNKKGIGVSAIADNHYNIIIQGNLIEYSKYYGLNIETGRCVLVEGNVFRRKPFSYTNPDDTDSATATSYGVRSTLQDELSIIRNEVISLESTDDYAVDLQGCVCEGNCFKAYRVNFEGCRCIGNYMDVDRRTFTIKDSYFAENLIQSSGSAAGVCIDLINGKLIGNKINCIGGIYAINLLDEGNNIIKDNDLSETTVSTSYLVSQNDNKIKLTLFADNICDLTKEVDTSFALNQTIARPYCMEIGITSARPTLHADYKGFIFFDSTLGKSILWNGSAWVNVDGSALS